MDVIPVTGGVHTLPQLGLLDGEVAVWLQSTQGTASTCEGPAALPSARSVGDGDLYAETIHRCVVYLAYRNDFWTVLWHIVLSMFPRAWVGAYEEVR